MSFLRSDVSAKKHMRELVIFTERELEVLKQFCSLSWAWVYCLEKQFRQRKQVGGAMCDVHPLDANNNVKKLNYPIYGNLR